MPEVEIYTTPFCPFCLRAKRLLDTKGVSFTEIDLMRRPEKRREMLERSRGGYTVPQIFIDGRHVGGCDELYTLENEGKLDPLLQTGDA